MNNEPKTAKSGMSPLLWVTIACVVLSIVPGGAFVTLPLVYLNTILHEFGHALATIVSGGQVLEVRIQPDGSGTTMSSGGFGLLIASAGYVGAAVMGAGLIASGRNTKSASSGMAILAAVLGMGSVLWMRNGFGVLVAVLWFVIALAIAKFAEGKWKQFSIQFLGLQQCINAVQSLWVLLKINAIQGIENDALIASKEFPLPPMAFALLWCALSFLLMGLALRKVWSDSSNSKVV